MMMKQQKLLRVNQLIMKFYFLCKTLERNPFNIKNKAVLMRPIILISKVRLKLFTILKLLLSIRTLKNLELEPKNEIQALEEKFLQLINNFTLLRFKNQFQGN